LHFLKKLPKRVDGERDEVEDTEREGNDEVMSGD
jgi:hypothetical protein